MNLVGQAGWLVMVTSILLTNEKISRAELRLCFALGQRKILVLAHLGNHDRKNIVVLCSECCDPSTRVLFSIAMMEM